MEHVLEPANIQRKVNGTDLVKKILACPKCHQSVIIHAPTITCTNSQCGLVIKIEDQLISVEKYTGKSFFDDKHQTMHTGNETAATQAFFYENQKKYVGQFFKPGKVVLDTGCGPAIHYAKNPECFYIGLDYSYESVRVNKSVDLKIYGSAATLPLKDRSVDTIICFYSLHHMVGQTLDETRQIVDSVIKELGRVIKSGGDIVIFEINPLWPVNHIQNLVWNTARKTLREKLDMYFWGLRSLKKMTKKYFTKATFDQKSFQVAPLLPVYPVFALRWLKIPRILYPFTVHAYHWHFGNDIDS